MNSSSEKVRTAIAGAGYVSRYHLRALRTLPWVEVVGIADPDTARAQQVATEFAIPAVYGTLKDMMESGPEVVHILTPPASHCELTLEALRMGCHVLVEKPMAQTVEECDRMIDASHAAGRVLSVNHSMRFDPLVPKALELIRRGACGKVLSADYFRSSDYPAYAGGPLPAPFRDGGYPFRDLGVHALYLLEAFLGEIDQVETVYRSTGLDPLVHFDEWRALANAKEGMGHAQLSWNVRPMLNELLVQGTKGTMKLDFYTQTIALRRTMPAPKLIQIVAAAVRSSLATIWGTASTMTRFALRRLVPSPSIHYSVIAFHEALRNGQDPPVTPQEGRRIVYWVEQAAQQADADRCRRFTIEHRISPRILVTGGTGFLGRALMDRLRQQGELVRMLVRRPDKKLENDPFIDVVYGDLGTPEPVDEAMRGIELVYHVGAAMRGGAAEFERGTVWGTWNVVDACLRHGVKRLVHVSSLSVLDHAGHLPGVPVDENSALEPDAKRRGFYTQTKLEAERIVLEACRNRNLPAVILRPGQICGPGVERMPPSGTIALAGRWLVVGNGEHPVPFVYVDDVVDAILAAAQRPDVLGEVFQLVDPEQVTQREYAELCRRRFGSELRVVYVPKPTLMALSAGVELLGRMLRRNVPLTRYRVESIRPLWPCNCDKAREGLGWAPRTGVREGFRRMYGDKLHRR